MEKRKFLYERPQIEIVELTVKEQLLQSSGGFGDNKLEEEDMD